MKIKRFEELNEGSYGYTYYPNKSDEDQTKYLIKKLKDKNWYQDNSSDDTLIIAHLININGSYDEVNFAAFDLDSVNVKDDVIIDKIEGALTEHTGYDLSKSVAAFVVKSKTTFDITPVEYFKEIWNEIKLKKDANKYNI